MRGHSPCARQAASSPVSNTEHAEQQQELAMPVRWENTSTSKPHHHQYRQFGHQAREQGRTRDGAVA